MKNDGRNKQLFSNTIILGIGTLVPKIFTFLLLPILTKYLLPDEYGIYDLMISVIAILVPVVTLQIQQAIFRYLIAEKSKEKQKIYIGSSIIYLSVFLVLGCTLIAIISPLFSINSQVAYQISIIVFLESLYYVLGQTLRGLGKNVKYTVAIIINSILNFSLVGVFVVLLGKGINGVILSMISAFLISDIYMLFQKEIIECIHLQFYSSNIVKKMLKYSLPIVPSSISFWIVNFSDRIIVTSLMGVVANGIYAVSTKIPQLYMSMYNIFNLAWTETAARSSDDADATQYYSEIFCNMFNLLIGVILLLTTFSPIMFDFFVDDKYSEAYWQMPILFWGVLFNSLVAFYGSIYIALKETKNIAASSLIGAAINILINIIFIRFIGLYAASISTVCSYFIILLYRYYDIKKIIALDYNYKQIIIGYLAFGIVTIICYINSIYSMIIAVLIAVIYNVKFNKNFVKKVWNVIKRSN